MCAKCDVTSFIGLISVHWLLQAKGGSVPIIWLFLCNLLIFNE
ncbi:hypothetical protein FORC065_1138 [Yersinia enterocolitica]|nr:hypothetical protein FORC065_1138 [Yersinia enterocolitica]